MSANGHDHGPGHYIKIWAILLVLLVISICGPLIGIRAVTLLTAFGIAIVKALMVASEFMHLKFEKKFVSYILLSMLALVAVFFYGVAPDVMEGGGQNWTRFSPEASAALARPSVAVATVGKSQLKDPWVSTPELVSHGKELFSQNCAICHGPEGKGNGVGGASLNPKPRNFTSGSEKWKNGRSVVGAYKTLKDGVAGSGMASFAGLPTDDRWALLHFVLSLGPGKVPTPSQADLAKAGISAEAELAQPSVPVEFAIERMAEGK